MTNGSPKTGVRSPSGARTPVFGYSFNFRGLLKLGSPMTNDFSNEVILGTEWQEFDNRLPVLPGSGAPVERRAVPIAGVATSGTRTLEGFQIPLKGYKITNK
jgi:hypothetical protein